MQIKDLYRIKIDVTQVEIVVTDHQEFFVKLTERQLGEIHRNFETKRYCDLFEKMFERFWDEEVGNEFDPPELSDEALIRGGEIVSTLVNAKSNDPNFFVLSHIRFEIFWHLDKDIARTQDLVSLMLQNRKCAAGLQRKIVSRVLEDFVNARIVGEAPGSGKAKSAWIRRRVADIVNAYINQLQDNLPKEESNPN